ncbi:MAG: DUF342 domain-containing protein, partial [Fuerstiella sp.]|nr:DUF342 domain-containing protein [Fuerstiella sp.]
SDLGGNVTTTGEQVYSGAVTQTAAVTYSGADTDADGEAIDFGSTLAGGGLNTTIVGGAGFAGAVSGVNDLSADHVDSESTINASTVTVSGASDLGGNVTTTGEQVYSGAVFLTEDVSIETGASAGDNILFLDTVDGGHTLTLNAGAGGNITAVASIGANTPLTAVNVTDGAVQSFAGITAGSLTIFDATTSVTINAASMITNDVAVTSGGTITLDGKMSVTSGTLEFTTTSGGGDVTINAEIDPPSTVTLSSVDDVVINSSTNADDLITIAAGTDGSGSARINAGGDLSTNNAGSDIRITSGATTGAILLADDVTAIDRVTLTSNGVGDITQTFGKVTSGNLQVTGVATVLLTSVTNDVDVISANVTGPLEYVDTNALTVGTVVTSGVTTGGSDATLCATSILLTEDISAGAGTVRLEAMSGNISQTAGGITASGLGLRATNGISLAGTTNDVDTFAADGGVGPVVFVDTDGYTIGTVTASGCFTTAVSGISGGSDFESCVTTGNISITAALTVTGTVRLQTENGNITQTVAGIITTTNLGTRATGNVDLSTATNAISGTFAGASTVSGVLKFTDAGGFTVGVVNAGPCVAATTGATTASGNVDLLTSGSLTVSDVVTAGGTGEVGLNAAGVINVNAAVSSNSSHLSITGGTGVTHDANGDLTTTGTGQVNVTATTGDIFMADGTVYSTDSGDVTLLAAANVKLAEITTTSSGIVVTATAGNISDITTAESANLVSSATATLTAATGIGTATANADIDTAIGTLVATNTTSGDIFVQETDDLIISGTGVRTLGGDGSIKIVLVSNALVVNSVVTADGAGDILLDAGGLAGDVVINADVSSGTGNVTIDADNDVDLNAHIATVGGDVYVLAANGTTDGTPVDGINMEDANSSINTSGGSVRLEAQGGSGEIRLSSINAGVGNVALIADDDILDDTALELANVTAAGLLMIADADNSTVGTIGESNVLVTRTETVNVKAVNTAVDALSAHSGQGIYVDEANAVNVTSVNVAVDRADFDSGTTNLSHSLADLTTGSNGAIKLVADDGTITINGGGDATGVSADGTGDVLLESRT